MPIGAITPGTPVDVVADSPPTFTDTAQEPTATMPVKGSDLQAAMLVALNNDVYMARDDGTAHADSHSDPLAWDANYGPAAPGGTWTTVLTLVAASPGLPPTTAKATKVHLDIQFTALLDGTALASAIAIFKLCGTDFGGHFYPDDTSIDNPDLAVLHASSAGNVLTTVRMSAVCTLPVDTSGLGVVLRARTQSTTTAPNLMILGPYRCTVRYLYTP